MRIKLILFFLMACCAQIMAQSAYEISGNGQGKNGAYFVKVTTTVKTSVFPIARPRVDCSKIFR